MGASGSGKSTFMNILGCLDRPSAGRYLLDGVDVSRPRQEGAGGDPEPKLGFVFQGFNLLARTTALENVAAADALHDDRQAPSARGAPARRSRWSGSPTARTTFRRRCPAASSSASRSRARSSTARRSCSRTSRPGNLDSRTSVEIMEIFQDLNEQGLTIVLVTHEPTSRSSPSACWSSRTGGSARTTRYRTVRGRRRS